MPENARECPNFGERLDDKQLAAVELLILGRSVGKIAKEIGVDPKTLYRWRHEPQFVAVLNARRNEVWGDATGRFRDLTTFSLEVMAAFLEGNYDRTRLSAASTILRLANLSKHAESVK